jgi:preprotein translocase subunit SecB
VTAETTKDEFKIGISQILLQDVQFRHVGPFLERDPKTPIPQTAVNVEIELQRPSEAPPQASKPAALVRLRVTSDAPEAPYFYVVNYLAILTYEGSLPEDFERRLTVTGGMMVMPFVRELVANLSSRGRFGPTWLGPVNFAKMVSGDPSKDEAQKVAAQASAVGKQQQASAKPKRGVSRERNVSRTKGSGDPNDS